MQRRRFLGLALATGAVAAADPIEYVRRYWAGWRADNRTAMEIIAKYDRAEMAYTVAAESQMGRTLTLADLKRVRYAADWGSAPPKILLVGQTPEGVVKFWDDMPREITSQAWAAIVAEMHPGQERLLSDPPRAVFAAGQRYDRSYMTVAWARRLVDSERASLRDEPYQLFAPPPARWRADG